VWVGEGGVCGWVRGGLWVGQGGVACMCVVVWVCDVWCVRGARPQVRGALRKRG